MICPLCRLINPPEAGVCDCGYNFATGTIDQVIRATNAAERDRNKGWFQNTHWPDIYDEKSAKSAKQQGVGAAVLCSAITALFAVLGHLGIIKMNIDLGALADAALFAMIVNAGLKFPKSAD